MRLQPLISDSRFWYLNYYNYYYYTIAIINGTFPFGSVGHWTTGKRIKRNSHSGKWLFETKNDSLYIWFPILDGQCRYNIFTCSTFCDSFQWNECGMETNRERQRPNPINQSTNINVQIYTTQSVVMNMCPIKRESNSINWIITEMKDEKKRKLK